LLDRNINVRPGVFFLEVCDVSICFLYFNDFVGLGEKLIFDIVEFNENDGYVLNFVIERDLSLYLLPELPYNL